MIEQWYNLTLEPGAKPVLILDTSESAKSYWPVIRNLIEGILESMPKSTPAPSIFFLGNPLPHDASQFPAQADYWFHKNAGRGSFIGPIFDQFASDALTTVVVVGAGRIFDLPDWSNNALARDAIWCRFGPNSLTDGALPEESYACEQLAERMNNSSAHIEIGAAAAMPFYWDDPTFVFEDGRLVGSKLAGSLRLGFLLPDETPPSAAVVHTNGSRHQLPLAPVEPPPMPAWTSIAMGEFNLLKQCKKEQRFRCPACQEMHPFGQFRCLQQGSKPVFPTLGTYPQGGFCQLDAWEWEAKVLHVPCAAMKVGDQAVALRMPNGGAQVYRYQPALNSWQPAESFSAFFKLGEKLDAMVL